MSKTNGSKPRNPRRGVVKKTAADAPAQFEPGSALPPVEIDSERIAKDHSLYWKSGDGRNYMLQLPDKRWARWLEQDVIDLLRSQAGRVIAIKARDDERLSEVRRVFLWVRQNHGLDEVLPSLPGYKTGVHVLSQGEQVLVKSEARLPVPAAGEWETIRALIDGRLDGKLAPGGIDQTPWFHSWCKVALEAQMRGRPGQWRAGHAMILLGPVGCGKNRLQENLITPLLGGRQANPKKFLFEGDEFNADVYRAEHLCMGEIPLPSQKMVDRTHLSERIKETVANAEQRMRLMRTEPSSVYPFWRLTISGNDDPDKLRNLPPLTGDYADKVLVFHCQRAPLPAFKSDSPEDQAAWRDLVAAEVPAYAHWLLNEWKIPDELLTYADGRCATRFGFREFHHPVIKSAFYEDSPGAEMMALIDAARFTGTDKVDEIRREDVALWELPSNSPAPGLVWWERALKLQQLLTGETEYASTVATMAKKFFQHNNITRTLHRLAEDEKSGDQRVSKGDTRDWRGWKITARP